MPRKCLGIFTKKDQNAYSQDWYLFDFPPSATQPTIIITIEAPLTAILAGKFLLRGPYKCPLLSQRNDLRENSCGPVGAVFGFIRPRTERKCPNLIL